MVKSPVPVEISHYTSDAGQRRFVVPLVAYPEAGLPLLQ